jgi:predicted Zn-dependent protease with MMP-like domain
VQRRQFEALVTEALDELPQEFRPYLDNVAIVVEAVPTPALLQEMGLWPDHTLLGLYHGVPLPERGFGYGNRLPDCITIYQQPIEALYQTPREIKEAVKETVIHEIGHFFGLDDDQLEELMDE